MENKNSPLIKLKNVSKFYYNKGNVASGFNKVNLEFYSGEFVVITGESGSGKSTLLNVVSGLDTYEEGEMYINGKETSHYVASDFEHYRKTYIGNIFQSFNLINSYTVYQNIELVLLLNGFKKKDIKDKVIDLIKQVDLYKYRNTRVSHLSGGQKQRVAIARALAKDTPIIIADEPTGNLDTKSATSVLKLLSEIANDKLVIIVTHNYEQVEKYATRKIEMHDGKVREDITLKDDPITSVSTKEYKDITFFNKIRIGLRNTFNIIPKFALMFLVFIFLITAFIGAYSAFKKVQYEEGDNGYNWYFNNYDSKRIIINKKDKSFFTDDELASIKNIANVDKIIENDVFLDTYYSLNDKNYNFTFYGKIESINDIKSVDKGRMPDNENEVVVKVYNDNYYVNDLYDSLLETKLELTSNNGSLVKDEIKVVGVILVDRYEDDVIYTYDSLLEKAKILVNESFSEIGATFTNDHIDYVQVIPISNLKSQEAYVSNEMNYLCSYSWCRGKGVKLDIKNAYYDESLNLTIKDVFYKSNIKALTGYKNYDNYINALFISDEDYNYLFNRHTYQISIYSNDSRNVEEIVNTLGKDKYNIVDLKNAVVNESTTLLAAIKIVKTVVLIVLFIVLFFITYFVIKLIQKSKNIYYSTVRILGGSSKVIKSFIRIELFTIYNLTYIIFIGFILLVNNRIINIPYIKSMITYINLLDYVYVYIILLAMSFLIANRYSRKLFKSSAMKAYREDI